MSVIKKNTQLLTAKGLLFSEDNASMCISLTWSVVLQNNLKYVIKKEQQVNIQTVRITPLK